MRGVNVASVTCLPRAKKSSPFLRKGAPGTLYPLRTGVRANLDSSAEAEKVTVRAWEARGDRFPPPPKPL